MKINNIRIAGFAGGVPKNVLKTVSTSSLYDDESYIKSVGVREKRVSYDFTTSDFCEAAMRRLIADLNWEKDSIDLLIMVTQTPDYSFPATSCVLHGKMGFKKSCAALDISLGCSGWAYAMSVALSMMSCGQMKRAIVLSGDARSPFHGEHDQLFGFAGTATALEYDESADPITIDLGTDGTGYDAIIRPGGGARNPIGPDSFKLVMCEDGRKRHSCQTIMKGMDVFAFGITAAPKSIKKVLQACNMSIDDIDYFVLHQANIKMLETIRKKIKVPEEKMPYGLVNFGNTSSASIPLAIVTELRGKLESGKHNFIACGFGVGLSWGTLHFVTDERLVISELQEL